MPNPIPAEWLPHAAQSTTAVWVHPDYDDEVSHLKVARDWQSRGEGYLRKLARVEPETRLVAVFAGHLKSLEGSAINP